MREKHFHSLLVQFIIFVMNTKTQETNQQVIARMSNAFDNVGNVEENSSVLDGEMRKLILKRGKQVFARKTISTKEFLAYVDNTVAQLLKLQELEAVA